MTSTVEISEYSSVVLKDGTQGVIVDVLKPGVAYWFEVDHPEKYDDQDYVWRIVGNDDVAEVADL